MEEQNSNVRYLNLGCGDSIFPKPWENLDIRPINGVDHISEVYPLDFEDNIFDLVYASHLLEHFKRIDTQKIVNEWVRVVKPGGLLRISVPSLPALIKIYEDTDDIEQIMGPLMGGQTYDQNFHYMAFDKNNLTKIMKTAGLIAIHPWDYRRTSHTAIWDFSQAKTNETSISLNLEGRKSIDKIEDNIE